MLERTDAEGPAIGDAVRESVHAWNQRSRVKRSDVDLLRDLDHVVELDAEVARCAFDFGMSDQ